MEIVIVAAVAENGVIGREGELPWHYPEDLERFRRLTTGNAVVMGRKTFESIHSRLDGPLPDRLNVVLTRSGLDYDQKRYSDVREADSIEAAGRIAREEGHERLFVAGGESVYSQFLDRADRMELTRVHRKVEGDSFFPEVDWSRWNEVEREERGEISFVSYRR